VYQVAHAYGTNGIITAPCEIPLAQATIGWGDRNISNLYASCTLWLIARRDADVIIKKLVTVFADPIPQYFTALRSVILEGSAAFVMVSEESLEALAKN
jgi:hypothetical protein